MTSRGPVPAGIHLGFEVGTGAPIAVPLGHLVITGQTQLSGKTTTLEALISRSGRAAIAFVTKRGEGSFAKGRTLPPYFRERADWQFVASILESQLRERMRFERAWIMRACKGAKTLGDVRKNVRHLMEKSTRGMDRDVYMVLGEYLDLVVPLIERLPKSPSLDLEPGLNVMDLREYPEQLQGLVVRSALEWVHEKEEDVISVVPEAWKFMPRGRSSPVKLAAVPIAREGAALGNLLWIDVQDIAGAEYEVMRQASVWLLGVQRERNEVKRALEQIPAGFKKPRPEDVTSLQRGHFWACLPTGVHKVYVQPAWLDADTARRVAMGEVKGMAIHAPTPARVPIEAPSRRIDMTIGFQDTMAGIPRHAAARMFGHGPIADAIGAAPFKLIEPEDEMAKEDVQQLEKKIEEMGKVMVATLVAGFDRLGKQMAGGQTFHAPPLKDIKVKLPASNDKVVDHTYRPAASDDELLDRLIARLRDQAPAILKVLASRPEIDVEVERETIVVDGKTLRGRIARLIATGFFASGKRNNEVSAELARVGFSNSPPNSMRELKLLAEQEFLIVTPGDRFEIAPGAVVRITEK